MKDKIIIIDDQFSNDSKIISGKGFNEKEIYDYPVNYLLYSNDELYVGETTKISNRIKEHLKNNERRKLKYLKIIFHSTFNQSATYNIETNLINYFLADNKFKLQNKSQTSMKVTHNYYNKSFYNNELFQVIWEKLKEKGLVVSDLKDLNNTDVFKLSPFKELTEEQYKLQNEIIEFCKNNIRSNKSSVMLIDGEAGTGKSVLLSSTFKLLNDLASDNDNNLSGYRDNFVLVNHNEMYKTYKSIASRVTNLSQKMFMKPTTFVNKHSEEEKVDVVFVDEAHLLLTQKDSYNSFKYNNHLEEIIKRSKITIIFYDSRQVLKFKSYWDNKIMFNTLAQIEDINFSKKDLTTQLRMKANVDTQKWMTDFTNKKIAKIPEDDTFRLKIYDDVNKMYADIKEKNHSLGLSRMVATFDWIHKKDGADYFVTIGDFSLPWNRTSDKDTWAERKDSINEMGSIYTVQGFDLNYVGVVIGPSITYSYKYDTLIIKPDYYKDTEAFKGLSEQSEKDIIKEEIILNSLNVLLKRGVRGTFIYACDENLRKRLLELQEQRGEI